MFWMIFQISIIIYNEIISKNKKRFELSSNLYY